MNLVETARKIANKITGNDNNSLEMTIIKELLHYDILEALYDNDIGKKIVFQGGTALRLCHYNNRFSEDLDFVIDKDFKFETKDMDFFKDYFSNQITNKYNLETEVEMPKEDDNIVKKYTAKILLPLNRNQKAKINIEIAQIPSYDNQLTALINNYPQHIRVGTMIKAESKEEIFADKIIALASREYIKYRDFWDIKFLTDNRVSINKQLVEAKIKDYKIQDFDKKLSQKLEICKKEDLSLAFENEMVRFLEPKLFNQVKEYNYFDSIKKAVIQKGEEALKILRAKENINSIQNNIKTAQNTTKTKQVKPKGKSR